MPSTTPDRSSQRSARSSRGRDSVPARWRRVAGRGTAAGAVAVLGLGAAAAGATAAVAAPRAPGVTAAASRAQGATAAGPRASATPSWQIVRSVTSGPTGDITAVTAAGKSEAWAFNAGAAPTAYERLNGKWFQAPFPGKTGEKVVAAAASSAQSVWAFTDGSRARAMVWNGTTWTVSKSFSKQIGGAVVLAKNDVWVFGAPAPQGSRLGAWHYNGTTWTHVTDGSGLEGGSGLSSGDVWAFKGTNVANWDGAYWITTSVASLLPAASATSDPQIVGIQADSPKNVYAIGTGGDQTTGGPLVILHFNGSVWTEVAQGNYGEGTAPLQAVSSDGNGGLWIPMPASGGQPSSLLHYTGGQLTKATLPVKNTMINVESVGHVLDSSQTLAGGFTHAAGNPASKVVSVILQYGS
jgi:hypothetical protein